MAIVSMALQAAVGVGFWDPTVLSSAVILRTLQFGPAPSIFALNAIIIGLFVYLLASVLLAYPFAIYVAPRLPSSALPGAGGVYGAVVFLVSAFFLLPTLNPVMFRLNGGAF